MPVNTFSLLHHHALPRLTAATTFLLLRRRKFSLLAAKHNHNNPTDDASRKFQHTLKAREREKAIKHFSSLSSLTHPPTDKHHHHLPPQILSPNQAIAMVASAEANFMRVVVLQSQLSGRSLEGSGSSSAIGVELLCVVRAVLKKIKRRVLVGDKVLVGSIDWVDRRGMIENVFPRESEILDPPIANANHFLVLFAMDQPKLEPFSLTRFLVEAESTRIPVTLALNKCELVGEEV